MNTFAPIFSKIVDSSLWSEPDFVCKAFLTLIAIKDSDHVARINAFALGRKCWPLEPDKAEKQAIEALKILQAPDKKRIEPQPHDGRRITKVDDGYLVLNGQFYEDMMRETSRKVYKARKEREYRAKKKSYSGGQLPGEAAAVKALEAGDVATFDKLAAAPAEAIEQQRIDDLPAELQ